jgi:hypothetical protein
LVAGGKSLAGDQLLIVGHRFQSELDSREYAVVAWLVDARSLNASSGVSLADAQEVVIDRVLVSFGSDRPSPFTSLAVTPVSVGANDGWLVAYQKNGAICGWFVSALMFNPGPRPPITYMNANQEQCRLNGQILAPATPNSNYADLAVAGSQFRATSRTTIGRYLLAFTEDQFPGTSSPLRLLRAIRFNWQNLGDAGIRVRVPPGRTGANPNPSRNLGRTSGDVRLAYDRRTQSHWLLVHSFAQGTGFKRTRVHRLGHNGVDVQRFVQERGFVWPFQHAVAHNAALDAQDFAIAHTGATPELGVYGRTLAHSTFADVTPLPARCGVAQSVSMNPAPPYSGDEFFTVLLRNGPPGTATLNVSPRRLPGVSNGCQPMLDMTDPAAFTIPTSRRPTGHLLQLPLSERSAFRSLAPTDAITFPRQLNVQWQWTAPVIVEPPIPGIPGSGRTEQRSFFSNTLVVNVNP